jgi:hypothetical protein
MSRLYVFFLLTLTLFTGACGYGSHYMGGNGAPAITTLAPNTATAGDPLFTLTVNGSGFGVDSVVFWNGTALPTAYGTTTQVRATVSAADVAVAGMIPVYVRTGGKNSNMINFTVQ